MTTTPADIVGRANERYRFIRTTAGEPYAIPEPSSRNPSPRRLALTLDQVAAAVSRSFYEDNDIPSTQSVAAAMTVLSAQASESTVEDVHLRLARIDGVTYLDLGTPGTEYVEISATGWTVRRPLSGDQPSPALFTRTATTGELPIPVSGVDGRAELARLLALSTEDDRFRIAWGWLVAQCLPETARPMIYFLGSQGSGKTTRGLMLANVLEPQSEMGAVLKRSERENNPVAKANYILTADNMTKVSEDVSNWLCSLVTGHRVIERKLYTNNETVAYSLKRTGLFTGKTKPAGLESDAEERMLFLEFERMQAASIKADDTLMEDFRAVHSGILAAVLDDMVAAQRRLSNVADSEVRGFRFVNFAKVFVALDRRYGLTGDAGHLAAVIASANDMQTERVWETPDLLAVMRAVAEEEGGTWHGEATELLDLIARARPDNREVFWPATAKALSTRLRNNQHALSLAGLRLDFKKSNGRRVIHATLTKPGLADELRQPQSIEDIADVLGGNRK